MTKWYRGIESEADFPTPFGIWDGHSFAIYAELAHIKSTISNNYCRDGVMSRSVKVYEFTEQGWSLIYDLPRDSLKRDCPLWHGVAPKTGLVSEAAVNAAIASIVGGSNAEEEA